MKFDLHIHSKYSFDSFLNPAEIVKIAKKKGLDGVAVTDHNTIKGGIETSKINNKDDLIVIVGSEIKTEYGDVIGLFLNEDIKSRQFVQVTKEIKDQGGIVILAHPFRKCNIPIELLKHVEVIEAFNARSSRNLNVDALKLAKEFKKPMTAGSDAHICFEIGRGRTIASYDIKSALAEGRTEIEGEESNYYLTHGSTILLEKIKYVIRK